MAARSIKASLAKTEWQVMKAVWEKGEATVKEVLAALQSDRSWAYTTVMTMLDRLHKKGYVRRAKSGKAYTYCPAVSRTEATRGELTEFLERVFDGAVGPLVANLVESGRLTEQDVQHLKRLVSKLRNGGSE